MRRYLTWGLMALGLATFGCTQLPFFNTGASTSSQPAAKTPTPNHDPIIRSLTAHRFENASGSVALWVQPFDPDCDDQRISWSVTEGVLSSTVGTDVTLTPTATRSAPYVITAQVSVSDGRGGTAQGSLNVQVGSDGVPMMATEATASLPTPEPCSTPTPEPTAQSPSPGPGSNQPVTDPPIINLDGSGVHPIALRLASGRSDFTIKVLEGEWMVDAEDLGGFRNLSRGFSSEWTLHLGSRTRTTISIWDLRQSYQGNNNRIIAVITR